MCSTSQWRGFLAVWPQSFQFFRPFRQPFKFFLPSCFQSQSQSHFQLNTFRRLNTSRHHCCHCCCCGNWLACRCCIFHPEVCIVPESEDETVQCDKERVYKAIIMFLDSSYCSLVFKPSFSFLFIYTLWTYLDLLY